VERGTSDVFLDAARPDPTFARLLDATKHAVIGAWSRSGSRRRGGPDSTNDRARSCDGQRRRHRLARTDVFERGVDAYSIRQLQDCLDRRISAVREDIHGTERGRLEGLKRFRHPELGRFDLEFTSFEVAEQPSLRLYLYTPADDGRSETTLREIAARGPAPSSMA